MYFYKEKIKRLYKILTYYKRLFVYYFHVFRENIIHNAIMHSLGNIRKVSSQLFAFLIKFGYKFNQVFLASLKSFFIKILVLKNVQKNKNTLNSFLHNFYMKAASYLSKKLFGRLHKPKININDSFL